MNLRWARQTFLATGAVLLALFAGAAAAQDDKKGGDVPSDGLKNLRHPDANIRYRTAAVLAEQGPLAKYAIAELREALQDTDPLVRVKVAEALWKVERPSPGVIMPTLQRALKDKNPEARAAACGVIGLLGAKGKAAIPTLIDSLKDKDLTVVMAAVNALGDIGPIARESAAALLQLSGYADFFILEPFVGAALGNMGEAVVPELAAALSEKTIERRRVAAYALGSMGAEARGAVKALTKSLDDDVWNMRFLAARALGNIGKEATSAVARLGSATSDKMVQVRIQSALAVWQIAGETKYVPLLARALEDESVAARESACQALTTMAADAKDAVAALTRTLADKEPTVRQGAIVALGSIGPAARDYAAPLRPLLKDTDKAIRLHSAFALWQITGEPKESTEVLRSLVAEPNLQAAAVAKLGAIGPAARDALPELVTMYREEDRLPMRQKIAEAIKKIDPNLATKLGIR
jgi:HEAT repeat protein